MGHNVLLIAGWYPTAANPLHCIFVKEQAQAVAQDNHVIVLHSEGIDTSITGRYQLSDTVEDGLRTLRLRYKGLGLPRSSQLVYWYGMFAAVRQLYREGFRPDLIHAHVYNASFIATMLGKRYKLPVVISEHSSQFFTQQIRPTQKRLARYAFQRAALVCPVSQALQAEIEKTGFRARFQVVPNLVDIDRFTLAPVSHKNADTPKKLLFVGNLIPLKGLPYLLEALAMLKAQGRHDFQLDILGKGAHAEEYQALTAQLGLSEHVQFHGSQSRERVAELMQNCDFLVHPSRYETFGIVLIEALASGKPVIACDTSGPREILNNTLGILVPPMDSSALAQAIYTMLDHYQDYSPATLREYVTQRYSRAAVTAQWGQIYDAVAQKSTG